MKNLTMVKVLSNFDTTLSATLKQDFEKEFGEGNVLVVHKSPYFYYRNIGFPFGIFLVLLIVGSYFLYSMKPVPVAGEIGFGVVIIIYFIALMAKNGSKRVSYKMDFLVITPKELIKYNQSGLFSRKVEKINGDKLKSISITKEGILRSFLNIGKLSFLVEGDLESGSDIEMDFVDGVESVEKEIRRILQ